MVMVMVMVMVIIIIIQFIQTLKIQSSTSVQ